MAVWALPSSWVLRPPSLGTYSSMACKASGSWGKWFCTLIWWKLERYLLLVICCSRFSRILEFLGVLAGVLGVFFAPPATSCTPEEAELPEGSEQHRSSAEGQGVACT